MEPNTTPTQWRAGQVIEAARENLYLSRREAAYQTGISESRWRQIESGTVKNQDGTVSAPFSILARMADTLELEIGYLIEVAGGSQKDIDHWQTTGILNELVKQLTPEQQVATIAFIRTLRASTPH